MRSPISSILRGATREKNDKLNVISICTHESYESNLARTGHNFYHLNIPNQKKWNHSFRCQPDNITLLKPNELPSSIDFDLVLSQNTATQYDIARSVASSLNIPHIKLEHCVCDDTYTKEAMNFYASKRGDVDVFISEYSKNKWGYAPDGIVIEHGIDTEEFSPNANIYKENEILSVVNDYKNRSRECGYHIWKEVVQGLPYKLVGDNPGLSEPAGSAENLIHILRKSRIFLNTSLVSPCPMSLLESASCGMAIVSTDTCAIPDFFINGGQALLGSNVEELKYNLKILLENSDICQELGKNARELIKNRFSLDRFIKDWDTLFASVVRR